MALVYRLQFDKHSLGKELPDMIIRLESNAEIQRMASDPVPFLQEIGAFMSGMDTSALANPPADVLNSKKYDVIHESSCQLAWDFR
ncbi:MAG: hypothetical protein AAGJ50_15905 [Pseudomonadota bacterium]